jgi:hypothetical protein
VSTQNSPTLGGSSSLKKLKKKKCKGDCYHAGFMTSLFDMYADIGFHEIMMIIIVSHCIPIFSLIMMIIIVMSH